MTPGSRLRFIRGLALAAAAAGVCARLGFLGRRAVGFDEAAAVLWSRDGLLPLVERVARLDAHPPLFYILQYPFARLAEAGAPAALALRLLPALCGLLTLWAVWRAGRELAGEEAGALAAGFLALLPMHVHFSRIGRMYAPAGLFVALCLLLLARLGREGRRGDAWLLAATALAAGLTHYYTLVVLPFLLLATGVSRPRTMLHAPLAALFWGLLPWALLARSSPLSGQFRERLTGWLGLGGGEAFVEGLRQLEFDLFFLGVTPALLALLLAACAFRRLRTGDGLPLCLALACAAPGAALALLSLALHALYGANTLQPNHLSLVAPLFALALGVAVSRARPRLVAPLSALLLASAGAALLRYEAGQAVALDARAFAPLVEGRPAACPDEKSALELLLAARPSRVRVGPPVPPEPGEVAFARADTRSAQEAFLRAAAPGSCGLTLLVTRGECALAYAPRTAEVATAPLPPGFRLEAWANGRPLDAREGKVALPPVAGLVEFETRHVAGFWLEAAKPLFALAFLALLVILI